MRNIIKACFIGKDNSEVFRTLPISKEEVKAIEEQLGGFQSIDYGAESSWYDSQDDLVNRDVLNEYLGTRTNIDEMNHFAEVFAHFERAEHYAMTDLIEKGRVINLYWFCLDRDNCVVFGTPMCAIMAAYDDCEFDLIARMANQQSEGKAWN